MKLLPPLGAILAAYLPGGDGPDDPGTDAGSEIVQIVLGSQACIVVFSERTGSTQFTVAAICLIAAMGLIALVKRDGQGM